MAVAQVLGDIIGDIGNAAYTPEPNPAYGAVQVSPEDYVKHLKDSGIDLPPDYQPPSQHMWLTPDGKDMTYAVNNLGMDPNQPFHAPGFLSKLVSSQARGIQVQNAAAQAYPGQQSQLTQAELGNAASKKNVLSRDYSAATGLPNNNQLKGLVGSQGTGAFQTGVPAGAMTQYDVAGKNVMGGIDNALSDTQRRQAATADIMSQGQAEAAPGQVENLLEETNYTTPYELLAREATALHPGMGSSSYMMGSIDPFTRGIGSVKNPSQSMAGVLVGNAMPGQNEYEDMTLPSGKTIRVRKPDVSPLTVPHVSPYADLNRHQTDEGVAEQPPTDTRSSNTVQPESKEHIKALLSDPQLPHGLKYILAHTLLDTPDWMKSINVQHDPIVKGLSSLGHTITGE